MSEPINIEEQVSFDLSIQENNAVRAAYRLKFAGIIQCNKTSWLSQGKVLKRGEQNVEEEIPIIELYGAYDKVMRVTAFIYLAVARFKQMNHAPSNLEQITKGLLSKELLQ